MKKYFLLSFLFLSVIISKAQVINVDGDANHKITYEIVNDSLKFYVEVLNDFILDIDEDNSFDVNDDFAYLMFDLNANGAIDLGGNQIDLFYTHDSSKTKGLCNGNITSPTTKTACQGNSGGYVKLELKASVFEATPHVYYTFSIPKQELDYNSTLCARMSVKIHTGGTPIADAATFPNTTSTDDYYVNPYNSVLLYPQPDLGEDRDACVGDTIYIGVEYPEYLWNTLSQENFTVVNNLFQNYEFNIEDGQDPSCTISDAVKLNILDPEFCDNSYSFPNIITPNGDGMNDDFKMMIGLSVIDQDWTGAKLKIYNRWGIKVYESPDDAFPIWDIRTENGTLVTAGTYFYTFLTPGTSQQRVNGFFSVVHND